VQVGKRAKGGYECELDVIAFHPEREHLVHIEPPMDAHTWAKREKKFTKKFQAGRKYIPTLFNGVVIPVEIAGATSLRGSCGTLAPIHCGYLTWFRGENGEYRIVREETGHVTTESLARIPSEQIRGL
jgi:hypothetical protein